MKVLVTRTDRLGDLVLSLPVFAAIKRARPDWEVHALVAQGLVPLVEHDPHIHSVWVWSTEEDPARRRRLRDELAGQGFAAAVMLQYRQELAVLLRSAGIKRRYGPLSKLGPVEPRKLAVPLASAAPRDGFQPGSGPSADWNRLSLEWKRRPAIASGVHAKGGGPGISAHGGFWS
jgi:hypothetical protein